MRGLLAKILRETWFGTLLHGLGLMVFMAVLTAVLPEIQQGIDQIWRQIPFVQRIVSSLLGVEVGDEINAQLLQSILWVHPVVLALLWSHAIQLGTRMPAGEIDRGTIDILLSLPVSRRAVYMSESLMLLASGALIIVAGVMAHLVTAASLGLVDTRGLGPVILIALNLFSLYLAVAGTTFLVSSMSDRRGRAVGIILALVLVSFLVNFLQQFWEPAKQISFLSVLTYYRPAQIIRDGAVPIRDPSVLLGVAILTWAVGGEIVARRSILTI